MADRFERTDNRQPLWTIVAEYPPGLNAAAIIGVNQHPLLQHWFQVLDRVETMIRAGATEVRIRPVKP